MENTVEILVTEVPIVSPQTPCEDVFEIFQSDVSLLVIAVIDDDRPVGLVNRTEMILRLADRFGRALYEKRPISSLMHATPLIVDSSNSIDFLTEILVKDEPNALMTGFIICRGQDYLGVGTALSLLQATSEKMKIRAEQAMVAQREAEDANRSKTMFLSNMNHELRTPLNAIIGFTEIIKNETYGAIAQEEYREYVDIVHGSGQHLLSVINAILDMSKIEAGKLELNDEIFDLEELIQKTTKIMSATATKKNILIQPQTMARLPEVKGDVLLLRQVLLNLLSNAVKFSPEGSTVTLVAYQNRDGGLSIEVIDQGIGIRKEQLSSVTQPFFQVDSELNRVNEGSGLGLSIVRAYLDLHGAVFNLESEYGKGTRAIITLPKERIIPDVDADLLTHELG
ncbi:MAG: hypothetical protein CMF31_03070 [Kordiimonas sp.]|nr:hypothetical protein [Kordiimonas sp.]